MCISITINFDSWMGFKSVRGDKEVKWKSTKRRLSIPIPVADSLKLAFTVKDKKKVIAQGEDEDTAHEREVIIQYRTDGERLFKPARRKMGGIECTTIMEATDLNRLLENTVKEKYQEDRISEPKFFNEGSQIVSPDNEKEIVSFLLREASAYMFVGTQNRKLWIRANEPRYCVMTYARNRFICMRVVEDFAYQLPRENFFNANEHDLAESFLKKEMEEKGCSLGFNDAIINVKMPKLVKLAKSRFGDTEKETVYTCLEDGQISLAV